MLENPEKLSERINLGLEPTEEQLGKLAKDGFNSIINLSTKGEPGQEFAPEDAARKAEALGLKYFHFPVTLSRLKLEQATEFIAALNDLPEPVYIHCRIGQRAVPFALLAYATTHRVSSHVACKHCAALGTTIDAPLVSEFVKKCLEP